MWKSYKYNLLFTLLHRAFKLRSNFELFHHETDKLKTIFKNNVYPKCFVDICIKMYLDKDFIKKEVLKASRKELICVLPFIVNTALQLRKLCSNHLVNWVCCSLTKIPLRKRSALTWFTDSRVITARLLILVKHTATSLLELQSIWVYLI